MREHITDQEAVENMMELTKYAKDKGDMEGEISVTIGRLTMTFQATIKESEDEND